MAYMSEDKILGFWFQIQIQVVPDVVLSQTPQTIEEAKAATSSRSVLAGIMANPAGFGRYKFAIEQARYFKDQSISDPADHTALQVDKALVNVAALMLENISGRVSVEVDPRKVHDVDALKHRAEQLVRLFSEVGVPKERIVLRMPGTWEAIQAAKVLEKEGLACHLVGIYSFVQAVAAAQAGVSVLQVNVGRLSDWFDKHPGVLRDRNAPREAAAMAAAGYGASQANPGVLLMEKIYAYCQRFHAKTKLMASGLRTKTEVLGLAGLDFLIVGPRVLEALQSTATLEGYNDGLRASVDDSRGVQARLTPAFAEAYEFNPLETGVVDKATFEDQLTLAGRELLEQTVSRLVDDAHRLEPIFLNQVGGQE